MSSVIDICNLALANLGDEATVSSISPPDGSIQAAHCARFYPIARDQLLEMHAWSFAVTRVQLAETGTPPDQWTYQYALPASCIKVLKILPDGVTTDQDSEPFEMETLSDGTRVILTDAELATARYIKQVTDPSKFTPLFTSSLSWLLASFLCGPIAKDMGKKEAAYKTFMIEFARAAASDSGNVRRDPRQLFTPSSISARN